MITLLFHCLIMLGAASRAPADELPLQKMINRLSGAGVVRGDRVMVIPDLNEASASIRFRPEMNLFGVAIVKSPCPRSESTPMPVIRIEHAIKASPALATRMEVQIAPGSARPEDLRRISQQFLEDNFEFLNGRLRATLKMHIEGELSQPAQDSLARGDLVPVITDETLDDLERLAHLSKIVGNVERSRRARLIIQRRAELPTLTRDGARVSFDWTISFGTIDVSPLEATVGVFRGLADHLEMGTPKYTFRDWFARRRMLCELSLMLKPTVPRASKHMTSSFGRLRVGFAHPD